MPRPAQLARPVPSGSAAPGRRCSQCLLPPARGGIWGRLAAAAEFQQPAACRPATECTAHVRASGLGACNCTCAHYGHVFMCKGPLGRATAHAQANFEGPNPRAQPTHSLVRQKMVTIGHPMLIIACPRVFFSLRTQKGRFACQ